MSGFARGALWHGRSEGVMVPGSEFSNSFVDAMRARMEMSYFKYGPVRDAYPHKVNALESMFKRLDRYHDTGNTEWSGDAANFLVIEFMLPAHPRAHFRATEAADSPGRTAHDDAAHPAASNGDLTDDAWREMRGAIS